jgi:hypothetical protein
MTYPIIWGPASELGQKHTFIIAFILYTTSFLGQTPAKDLTTLLVTKFISDFFSATSLTNYAAVFADVWPVIARGPLIISTQELISWDPY